MTQARPNGASTGRHLLTSSSILSQDEQSSGRNVLTAKRTASTNVVSPGAAWAVSGARPANKLATRCRPLRGVYEEIRTP